MELTNVNGIAMNYRLDGADETAPVVMLSNSLASRLSMWDLQVPALTGAGYRVLRYDTRGHGGSEAASGPYSIELLTQDVLALIDALGIEQVHFCGLSMGGMIGQMLGTRHGDRLLSLALCATAAHMGPSDLWDTRIATVQEQGLAAVVDATIDRWFTKHGQQCLKKEIESVRQGILATTPRGYCACCAAIRDMDQRESIKRISVRTMVLVGEQDPGTTVSTAKFMHERIAGSELCVIPGAAHFVNVEQSAEFNAAVLAFLGEP